MARVLLTSRVTALEQQMHAIERRFDGLDAQISRFREEMHVALTATNGRVDDLRVEVLTALATTARELRQADEALRREMHVLHDESLAALAATRLQVEQADEALRREMHALHEESLAALAATRLQVEQGDEDTRRYMRVLHEEVVERLKRIQNG